MDISQLLDLFAPFATFLLVLFAFVRPAVVSIVNRVKSDVLSSRTPSWVFWIIAIVLGVGGAYMTSYLLSVVDVAQPPVLATGIFGALAGLSASGLVDVSKMEAGTKR